MYPVRLGRSTQSYYTQLTAVHQTAYLPRGNLELLCCLSNLYQHNATKDSVVERRPEATNRRSLLNPLTGVVHKLIPCAAGHIDKKRAPRSLMRPLQP